MLTVQAFCFLVFLGHSTCTSYNFIKLQCYQLSSKPFLFPWSLKEAATRCIENPSCVGIRQVPDNLFRFLSVPLINVVKTDESTDYLLDRSNNTVLKGAPTIFDSKFIFGIYYSSEPKSPNCPSPMNEVNGHCEGAFGGALETEERCKSFPVYMNASFNPTTGKCTVVRLQDLIAKWQ